jgi:hypothetical protein
MPPLSAMTIRNNDLAAEQKKYILGLIRQALARLT